MPQMNLATVALAVALAVGTNAAELTFDFSRAPVGSTPDGFRGTISGTGSPGEWKIVMDQLPSALPAFSPKSPIVNAQPVLAQLSRDTTEERYPIFIREGDEFGDFTISTRVKLVDGDVERMAGIAFRIQDEKNYYYIRANAVDNNVYFLKWVDGNLFGPIGSKVEVASGAWHELVIECRGNEIRCRFNGREAFPALQDNTFSSGKIGFWTKSDAVSYFADTRIAYTPREPFAQTLIRDVLEKYDRLLGLTIFASTTNGASPQAIASKDPDELGRPAPPAEQDVINRSKIYHLKEKGRILVVLPMRDNNGDTIAAVRVVMKALPGQTEKNAIARALPVVRYMESRVRRAGELLQ